VSHFLGKYIGYPSCFLALYDGIIGLYCSVIELYSVNLQHKPGGLPTATERRSIAAYLVY